MHTLSHEQVVDWLLYLKVPLPPRTRSSWGARACGRRSISICAMRGRGRRGRWSSRSPSWTWTTTRSSTANLVSSKYVSRAVCCDHRRCLQALGESSKVAIVRMPLDL
eukprot:755749-Hanusia_phi.AAC.8